MISGPITPRSSLEANSIYIHVSSTDGINSVVSLLKAIPGCVLAIDANGQPAMIPSDRRLYFKASGVNMNATGDQAIFTGLPAKWRIVDFFYFDPTAATSVSKAGLFTAPNGGGTAVVALANLNCSLAKIATPSITSAILQSVQTTTALYLNFTIALGLPGTVGAMLVIEDLT